MNPEIIVVIKGGNDELLDRVTCSLWAIARKAAKAGRAVPNIKFYSEYGICPKEILQRSEKLVYTEPVE